MASKAKAAVLDPVTLGESLREEFLVPMDLSRNRLAEEIGVPPQRIGTRCRPWCNTILRAGRHGAAGSRRTV